MIVSAIAGWFATRIWPVGVILVFAISLINPLIQYFRYESLNARRMSAGLGAYSNDAGVAIGGFAIEFIINLALFCLVWFLRSKFKPHQAHKQTDEVTKIDDANQ